MCDGEPGIHGYRLPDMAQIALILIGNIFGGPFAPTYAFHERLPRPSPGRGQAPEARTKAFHERLLRPSPGRGQAAQGGGKPTGQGQALPLL